MKLVWLLLLFLIFILINKKKSSFLSIYNGDLWNNYRIGDVVLMPKSSKFYDPKFHENVLYHTTEYPGSIAAEYIRRNKKNQDFDLLNTIINERKGNDELDDQTLVLHIRVGDVLCKKVWIDNAEKRYSKVDNTLWWKNVVDYIKNNGITKVVIMAGTHFNDCIEESEKYVLDRGNYLSNNAKVEYRLGKSPDDDLIFAQNAKHFITTGGGYGELLKMIVNKNKSGR